MNTVRNLYIHNFNFLPNNRLKEISTTTLLLDFYKTTCDSLNRINVSKNELAQKLCVNRRTITNWINKLVEINVIKFKFNGATILNPEYYFMGTEENFEKAKQEYKNFKGDR